VQAGRISGAAPLFERFSLGNAQTLRGWNKFDVAPLGGDRMAHGSVELGFDVFSIFYDAGSVWNQGSPIRVRHAVGFGLRSRTFGLGWTNTGRSNREDDWFITLGFPVEAASIRRPLFMMGFRF
jgi:outer membrane protein assembly factor BamA